jgi:propionyl-CoA carboxylase alpha chain
MQHPRFRSGEITTGFIAEEYPEGFTGAPTDEQLTADLSAIAAFIGAVHERRASLIDGQLSGPVPVPDDHVVRLDGGAEHRVHFGLDRVVVDGAGSRRCSTPTTSPASVSSARASAIASGSCWWPRTAAHGR